MSEMQNNPGNRDPESEDPVRCTATSVCPDVWRFDDAHASFYMIVGDECAVVVDTGMAKGRLVPVLHQYTALPLVLVITHGHGDHLYHADEFDRVYMSHKDIPLIKLSGKRLGIEKQYDFAKFQDIKHDDQLSFGNIHLRVIDLGGHSPGSVAFYDRRHNLIFSGDAIGSGWSVWLQLPGCLPVVQYREHLNGLRSFLQALESEPVFLPGHYAQRYFEQGDNPVCVALLEDMITLCTRVLNGDAQAVEPPKINLAGVTQQVLAARYGRAMVLYNQEALINR